MEVAFNPRESTHASPKERIMERVWEVARAMLFLSSPWFARRWRNRVFQLFGGKSSADVSLARKCRLDFPWKIEIGEFSHVGDYVLIRGGGGVHIGKNVCISEDTKILTSSHDVASPTFDLVRRPVFINDSVWIAMSAIILPGVTIGEGAVVAAGAVVTKDVEPWTVVAGNPAREIRKRELHA